MTEIRFTVTAVPIAQPRQSHRIIRSKKTGAQFVQNFTSSKHPSQDFKASVRMEAAKHLTEPLEGPVELLLCFVMPRPKNMIWKTRAMPRVPHVVTPDSDNLQKSVMDALKQLAWRDDSQVCSGRQIKVYAAGHELPKVEIVIRRWSPSNDQALSVFDLDRPLDFCRCLEAASVGEASETASGLVGRQPQGGLQ